MSTVSITVLIMWAFFVAGTTRRSTLTTIFLELYPLPILTNLYQPDILKLVYLNQFAYPVILWQISLGFAHPVSIVHGGVYLHLPAIHLLFLPPHSPSSWQALGTHNSNSHRRATGQLESLLQVLSVHSPYPCLVFSRHWKHGLQSLDLYQKNKT